MDLVEGLCNKCSVILLCFLICVCIWSFSSAKDHCVVLQFVDWWDFCDLSVTPFRDLLVAAVKGTETDSTIPLRKCVFELTCSKRDMT